MLKGLSGFGDMFKQMEGIQQKMADMQAELEELQVDGTSAGGMIKVYLNGKGDMKGIFIDPSLMSPDETEILSDLIVAAFNDARVKLNEVVQKQTSDMMGGLPLPPGFKLPF